MKNWVKKICPQTMVTIYSEDTEDEYINGFIREKNEEEILLCCVDRYGEYDGFLLLKTEGIYRIDFESAYEKKVERLYKNKMQQHPLLGTEQRGESLQCVLLRWAYNDKKAVHFGFRGSDETLCGCIKSMEQADCLELQLIDEYECRPDQGNSWIHLEKVKYIWADERRARDAVSVYRMRERETGKNELRI